MIHSERLTANLDGDFAVFLIGMRINKPWKVHKWLPVFFAMPRMLRELEGCPESGFLGHITAVGVIVQYWRSFDHLEAYARTQGLWRDSRTPEPDFADCLSFDLGTVEPSMAGPTRAYSRLT